MHTDDFAPWADVTLPSEGGSHLDRNSRRHIRRKHTLFVAGVLLFEEFPRGHADDARLDAVGPEHLVSLDAKAKFTAAGHEDYIGLSPVRIGQDVSSFGDSGCRRIFGAIESRNSLARKHERGGTMAESQDDLVCLDHFIGIAWSENDHVGHGAKRSQLFDGLMRGPVFSESDGVMRKDENRRSLHQRG